LRGAFSPRVRDGAARHPGEYSVVIITGTSRAAGLLAGIGGMLGPFMAAAGPGERALH